MTEVTEKPLRLKARDAEDLQVFSAILQDALAPVCDIAYDAAAGVFVLAMTRFRWEHAETSPDRSPVYERVGCALTVTGVTGVKCRAIDLKARGQIHELLAIMLDGHALKLVFAGDAALRLELGGWTALLEDFGAPWPTTHCPHHAAAEGKEAE